MTPDSYTLLIFVAGLLAGVGITFTVATVPAFLTATRRVYRYSRQHPRWGIGFAAIVALAELAAAAIIFSA